MIQVEFVLLGRGGLVKGVLGVSECVIEIKQIVTLGFSSLEEREISGGK